MPPPDESQGPGPGESDDREPETPWESAERERDAARAAETRRHALTLARTHRQRLREESDILIRCGFTRAELVWLFHPTEDWIEVLPRMVMSA